MSSKSDVTPNLQPGSDLERVFEGEFGDGEEIANFSSKINKVGVRELAPLPSRSPLFATNCDGTACAACCEEYSDAAFASRIARAADARLTRDRWVPTLSRENRWGGNRKFLSKFIRAK